MGLALLESVGRASSQIVLRKLAVKKVHFTITTLFTVYTGMPLSLLISAILIGTGYSKLFENIVRYSDEFLEQFVLLLVVAVIGTINQIIFNLALKSEDVFKVSVVKTADLFFIILLQSIFLNIHISWLNLFGVSMIFSSTFFILCFKYFDERYLESLEKREHKRENIEAIYAKDMSESDDPGSKCDLIKKIIFFKF